MKNVKISNEWLYHKIDLDSFECILKDERIRPVNKNIFKTGFNGLNFVSFSKRGDISSLYSSYVYYILFQFALITESDKKIKTEKVDNSLIRFLSLFPVNKRFSIYDDEYQIKGDIPISSVIAIKLPEGGTNIKIVEEYVNLLDKYEKDIPFLDMDDKVLLDKKEVKDYYVKKR